jgi:MFS transporter, DHA1 family, tetracycline resistance protein
MSEKFKNKPLLVIFFTVFLDLVGFSILMPIIPILLADPTSPFFLLPKSFSVTQGYVLMGFLLAVFPICQFFTAPVLGQLSDKYGRKKLLLPAIIGVFFSYIVFAVAVMTKNLPLMFVSRIISGIMGGSVGIAMAAIADVTKPEERAKAFGLIGMSFGLGGIIGPFLGGKLSDPTLVSWFTSATPFWFAAILTLINIILIISFFPETHTNKRFDLRIHWNKAMHNILHVWAMKNFRAIFATLFLYDTGFTFYVTFMSVFLINRFGFHQGNIADFFAYTGVWVILTQTLTVRKISDLFKDHQVLKVVFFAMALAMFMYTLASKSWHLLIIAPISITSVGLARAFINSLISKSVGADIQGETLGIASSISFLGQAIPPILSGLVAAKIAPQAPLYIAAITCLLAGLAFNALYHSPEKNRLKPLSKN